jgi:small-conductance mechanosensitive channel
VTLAPWDYLFVSFSGAKFPDLFPATWISSIVLLAALVILYNVRTRALRHHPPYLELYEWLLWTGIVLFSLLLVFSVFVYDFLFVLVTWIAGAAVLIWIRFVRFPPMFEVYARKLAHERYFTRTKFAHPESTIRAKGARPTRVARSGRTTKRRRRR